MAKGWTRILYWMTGSFLLLLLLLGLALLGLVALGLWDPFWEWVAARSQ